MFYHLEYPLKLRLNTQGFAVFWGTEQITGTAGFVNTYKLKGSTEVLRSDVAAREFKDLGCGCWSIKEPIGKTGGYFVWLLSMNLSHAINIRYEIQGLNASALDALHIGVELEPAYKQWFSHDSNGLFARDDVNKATLNRFFCLGAKADDGLPVVWFESQDNAGRCFSSAAQTEHGVNELVFSSFLSVADKPENACWYLPRTRLVVSDHAKVIEKFIARNRKRQVTQTNQHLFSTDQSPYTIKTVLANLPWKKDGIGGVRAGSRWPHLKDSTEDAYLPFPFFLSYASALLKYYCYESYLIDAIAEKQSVDEFLSHIKRLSPDLLVVETSTPSLPDDIAVLEKLHPHMTIVLCGPVLLLEDPVFMEKNAFASYILMGEYEQTLLELINALENNRSVKDIAGLIYRNENGAVVKNPRRELIDINTLPWPERATLPYLSYCDLVGDIPAPSAQMLSSRGCPFKCTFCLWPQTMFAGRNFRPRTSTDVADEMEYLVKILGFASVYFDDDTTNIGKTRMLELCSLIMQRGLNTVPWAMMARADLMDDEILEALKFAGLRAVKYGVESTTQQLLDTVNKQMDIGKTIAAVKKTTQLGIHVHLTFTLGLPGETAQTLEKTINDAVSLNPFSLQFSINTPYPGTQIYKTLYEKGYIVETDFRKFDGHYNGVVCTRDLSPDQLLDAKNRAYATWHRHQRKQRGLKSNLKGLMYTCKNRGLKVAALNVFKHFYLFARSVLVRTKSAFCAVGKIGGHAFSCMRQKGLLFGVGALFGGFAGVLQNFWRFHRSRGRGLAGALVRYVDYCRTNSVVKGTFLAALYVYFRSVLAVLIRCEHFFWPLRDKRLTGVSIKASRFIKGNVNCDHEFGAGAVIDGGTDSAFAEYDFVVRRTTVYNLYVKYANYAYRPVEIYIDGVLLKKRGMLENTGGWKKQNARVFNELSVHLSAGKHTLKIYSCGLLPHIHRFVFRSSDQDMGWIERPDSEYLDNFTRGQIDDVLSGQCSVLRPRVFWRRFRANLTDQTTNQLNTRMLAGIKSGTYALCGPEYAAIDLTNRCNQNCVACWMYSPGAKNKGVDPKWLEQEMDARTVMRLLDELSSINTRLVRFTGGGEPFLHPDLFALVSYAKIKGFETSLTTGLSGVDFSALEKLLNSGIDEISVSIWAGDAATYTSTHPGSGAERFEHIETMLKKTCALEGRKTRIVVCNVLCRQNYTALFSMYEFARNCGVDSVYFTLADPAGFDLLDDSMRTHLLKDALALGQQVSDNPGSGPELVFFKTGIIERLRAADAKKCDLRFFNLNPCTMGWYFTRILANGTVVPCCKGVEYPMGSIQEKSFTDIWFSKNYNEFRNKALEHTRHKDFFKRMNCPAQCDNLMHNMQVKNLLDSH